jgi:hypothetical protein
MSIICPYEEIMFLKAAKGRVVTLTCHRKFVVKVCLGRGIWRRKWFLFFSKEN